MLSHSICESGKARSIPLLPALLGLLLGFCQGCGGGGGTNPPPVEPPSNLVYPQTSMVATVGTAITTDTPTVTGTVDSYTVSPTLPAGLSLNSSTGAISGTPTAAVVQANYVVTASNSAGSTTATVQITVNPKPPSNLVYSQASIVAMVGVAITTDTPTVTGTVHSYSVSPALPAGLKLNEFNGAISGTPTAVAAQASYVVTAQNSAGSTSATIQITVNAAVEPPSGLVYPQASIVATVGAAITTEIPTVTGTVDSYIVSPALPAGLSLNASTGAISGTPTAVTVSAAYTITASNAGGDTTADVTIAVNQALGVVLDLGHAAQINFLQLANSGLLSRDVSGHWALWNYSLGSVLVSGDQIPIGNSPPYTYAPLAIAGNTVVIGIPNGLEVRSATDGHVVSTIVSQSSWWNLATDGSYICAGSQSELSAWSPTGQVLISQPGNYSSAKTFAAPGEILVALGAAGPNVVETVSLATGTSVVSPAFAGNFNSWFLDGSRFVSNLSTTVWVYSNTAAEQAIVTLPSVANLTGQGDWIWTFDPSGLLNVYAIGSASATASYNLPSFATNVFPSAMTIGALQFGTGASVIDLSGANPVKVDYTLPVAQGTAYAATAASQWVVGNTHGVVLDGASLSGTPRYLGDGQAWSIAACSDQVAIATASGAILEMDPSGPTLEGTINFSSSKLECSSDGMTLAGMADANDYQYEPDRTLNVFSLPTGTISQSWPYTFDQYPYLFDFTMSLSGTMMGQVLLTSTPGGIGSARQVTSITGGPIIWSDTVSGQPIQLSPDGTLIAVSNGPPATNTVTNIYKNGQLVTAVSGWAVGWIDDGRLLVNNYGVQYPSPSQYLGCTIYDPTGVKLATPSLPELRQFQTVTSDLIYSAQVNTIYSLSSGASTWTSSSPSLGVGAVAGSYVVFASGSRVLLASY